MITQVKCSNVNLEVLYTFLLDWLELHNDDHYVVHNKVYHPNLVYYNSRIHIRGRETRQTGNPSDEFPVLV